MLLLDRPGSSWLLLAASAATSASASRPGGFNPASTLPWAVPLLLLGPLFGFIAVLIGVRGRRAASNLTMLTALVMMVAVGFTAWARFGQPAPYRIALAWINIPIAFTGDPRFQGFGVDVAISVDRYALAGLAALLVVFLACLIWHRVGAAREAGQIRYHVNVILLLLAAAGVLVSSDLGELFGFWAIAGLATYLLLGQRWGSETSARASRLAFALPFLGDMALLSAVGFVYSRFGSIDLTKLPPMLHTTPGVGLKSLTLIALLLFAAVFIRAALWPFTAWLTAGTGSPASLLALVAGVWPVLAGALLLRSLPFVQAAGPQARPAATACLAVAAAAGPLLGLVGTELRRSLLLASSGAVALSLLGFLQPAAAAAGFSGLLAVSLGRAGALLAGSTATAAMRTVDLRQMGGGFERMRLTVVALLLCTAAFSLGPAAAAAWRPRTLVWLPLAVGLFVVALAGWRVVLAVAAGPLRRRRAFEPDRVREGHSALFAAAALAGVVGLVASLLPFFTAWIAFLDPTRDDRAPVGTYVLALVPVLAGVGLAALLFGVRKDRSLALAGLLGARLGTAWAVSEALLGRFVGAPAMGAVNGVEGIALPAAEAALGRAAAQTGAAAARPLPWLALAVGTTLVLAVIFGLIGSGARL